MKNSAVSLKGLRSRFALGLGLAMLAVLAASSPVSAQDGQGKYITEASLRLTKLVNAANGDGYKLHDNTFSIGGGWIKQGESNWVNLFTVQLNAGKDYRFLAAGDADAKDVDLQVTDVKDVSRVLKEDTSTAPEAIVNFRPETSGRFLVRVRLYTSDNNLPCVCLAIVMAK